MIEPPFAHDDVEIRIPLSVVTGTLQLFVFALILSYNCGKNSK